MQFFRATYPAKGEEIAENLQRVVDGLYVQWLMAGPEDRAMISAEIIPKTFKINNGKSGGYTARMLPLIEKSLPKLVVDAAQAQCIEGTERKIVQLWLVAQQLYAVTTRVDAERVINILKRGIKKEIANKGEAIVAMQEWEHVKTFMEKIKLIKPHDIARGLDSIARTIQGWLPQARKIKLELLIEETGLDSFEPDPEKMNSLLAQLYNLIHVAEFKYKGSGDNKVCRDWQKGNCKWGSRCKFKHFSANNAKSNEQEDEAKKNSGDGHRPEKEESGTVGFNMNAMTELLQGFMTKGGKGKGKGDSACREWTKDRTCRFGANCKFKHSRENKNK